MSPSWLGRPPPRRDPTSEERTPAAATFNALRRALSGSGKSTSCRTSGSPCTADAMAFIYWLVAIACRDNGRTQDRARGAEGLVRSRQSGKVEHAAAKLSLPDKVCKDSLFIVLLLHIGWKWCRPPYQRFSIPALVPSMRPSRHPRPWAMLGSGHEVVLELGTPQRRRRIRMLPFDHGKRLVPAWATEEKLCTSVRISRRMGVGSIRMPCFR